MYFQWVTQFLKTYVTFHARLVRVRRASVLRRDCGDLPFREILFFSDDEHNALVMTVLLERRGVRVQWATPETISRYLPEFACGLIIYDIPSKYSSVNYNYFKQYLAQVNNFPHSAVLVGLGELDDMPIVFSSLRLRTAARLSKPVDISCVANVLRMVGHTTINKPI
jgi:hypothetical protein